MAKTRKWRIQFVFLVAYFSFPYIQYIYLFGALYNYLQVTHFVLQLFIKTRTNVVCGIAELNLNFITSVSVKIHTKALSLYTIKYTKFPK